MLPSERPRAKTASGSDASDLRPARIVIADDDRIAREMLASILRGAGHIVEAVADGQEAVERVGQGGVELVLLDIVMPRLSGLEACRILKSITADGFVPVVLVTVKTDTASRVEGLRIGADDYVCKPFEEQELLARIGSMLRIKRLHDQVAQQRAKFERLSVHDELTGLYNYRYLHTRMTEEFKRAERYHEPFACVLVDIDQLRAVNEMSGRPAGDAAIRRVSEGIRRCVRDVDVIARYGGDEFLVVLPSTHFAGSVVAAERIWREVSGKDVEPSPPTDRRPSLDLRRLEAEVAPPPPSRRGDTDARWATGSRDMTISIGVALYPSRDVRSKDALLRAADAALSQAKREGGNRICVFQQQGFIYTPSVSAAGRHDAQVLSTISSTGSIPGPAPFVSNSIPPYASRFDTPAGGPSRRDSSTMQAVVPPGGPLRRDSSTMQAVVPPGGPSRRDSSTMQAVAPASSSFGAPRGGPVRRESSSMMQAVSAPPPDSSAAPPSQSPTSTRSRRGLGDGWLIPSPPVDATDPPGRKNS